jgi:hypothetical protein
MMPAPIDIQASTNTSIGQVAEREKSVIELQDRQLRDILYDTWLAIVARVIPLKLFIMNTLLVLIIERNNSYCIRSVDRDKMRGILIREITWVRTDNRKRNSKPPEEIVKDMIASPPKKGIPTLRRLVNIPVFDKNGRLLQTPGYDEESEIFLGLSETYPQIPETPSEEQLRSSVRLLYDELLVNFPFVEQADRCHAIAAIILPFVRSMIIGATPAHVFSAFTPGEGKSLLANIIGIITTGSLPHITPYPSDESEMGRTITSLLSSGPGIIILDNVKLLKSAKLCAVLTSMKWSDRAIRTSSIVSYNNFALWIITGNQISYSNEMSRRSVRCRLDSGMESPWTREQKKFKHSLPKWALENRRQLVVATLTIIQAWIAAGRPSSSVVLGGFEDWSRIVGGILENAGIEGFLSNQETARMNEPDTSNDLFEFLPVLFSKYEGNWITAGEIRSLAAEKSMITSVLGDGNDRSQLANIGREMQQQVGQNFAGFRIEVRKNKSKNSNEYQVVKNNSEEAGT